MNKRIRVAALITITMAVAALAPRVGEAIAEMETFRVQEVAVEGVHYLAAEEIVHLAAVPEGASVWDDPAPVVERVEAHPGVRSARVRRKFPGTLVVEVEERVPVALFPNPTLVPVDAEGALLPFDPARHRVDLPLVLPHRAGTPGAPQRGPDLTPVQIRTVAAELDRLGQVEPELSRSISDVALDAWGDLVVRLEEPDASLRYPLPISARRLEEGLVALADALSRHPDSGPIEVDLRFADQVVVRLPRSRNP